VFRHQIRAWFRSLFWGGGGKKPPPIDSDDRAVFVVGLAFRMRHRALFVLDKRIPPNRSTMFAAALNTLHQMLKWQHLRNLIHLRACSFDVDVVDVYARVISYVLKSFCCVPRFAASHALNILVDSIDCIN